MKNIKILLIAVVGLLIIVTSCGKDDDNSDNNNNNNNNNNPTKCYLKKILYDDGSSENMTYNGDLVTRIQILDKNNQKKLITDLSYKDGILDVVKIDLDSSKMKYVFSYIGTNVNTVNIFTTDDISGKEILIGNYKFMYQGLEIKEIREFNELSGTTYLISKKEYKYVDGNITEVVEYTGGDTGGKIPKKSKTINYTYDDKKSTHDSLGLEGLIIVNEIFGSKNNILTITVKDKDDNQIDEDSYNHTYEYNSNEYPTKMNAENFSKTKTEWEEYTYDCR